MSRMDIKLTPHDIDSRAKPFLLDERQWRAAVALVEATGYRGNFFAGLDRTTTRCFAIAIRQVLQQGRAKDEDRPVLDSLLRFLEGAGACGTTLSRNYKRWDRA